MKVAIVDHNKDELNQLSNEICEHYFPIEDIFVYKFDDVKEFIQFLYNGYQYRFVFLDEQSIDLITLKTIEELLPECPTIILTTRNDFIPLNNHHILQKPYDPIAIYNTLEYHVFHTKVRPQSIPVDNRNAISNIPIDEIYYIESYYGKVYIHTKDKKYTGRNLNFYYYELLLERFGFLAIHKSIMLNIEKVKRANLEFYILHNDTELKPSARKKYIAYNAFIEQTQNKKHYYKNT